MASLESSTNNNSTSDVALPVYSVNYYDLIAEEYDDIYGYYDEPITGLYYDYYYDFNENLEIFITNEGSFDQSLYLGNNFGTKTVHLFKGAQAVKFNDEGENVAIVENGARDAKSITLGGGGDIVQVDAKQGKNTAVNVVGGKGNDSIIVNNNAPVTFNMSYGGADKIILAYNDAKENVTIKGYNANNDSGIQTGAYDTEEIVTALGNGAVSFGDGQITIGGAKITFANNTLAGGSTRFNLFDAAGNKQAVGFTHSAGGIINVSYSSDNYVLVGNPSKGKGVSSTLIGSKGDNIFFGGAGNDYIYGNGTGSTIRGGKGNDTIKLYMENTNSEEDNVIQYAKGDGNDVVEIGTRSLKGLGFSIELTSGKLDSSLVNKNGDIVLNVDTGSLILKNARSEKIRIKDSTGAVSVINSGRRAISNYTNDTLVSLSKNRYYVTNGGSNVTVNTGTGSDGIYNYGDSVTINSGDNHDDIYNSGSRVKINSGAGNDSIYNYYGDYASINGGAGNDSIYNNSENVSLIGSADNDYIHNGGDYVIISGGVGSDYIYSYGDSATILGGDGADNIDNNGNAVTINGGAGNDSVYNYDNNVTINGGAGNDFISFNDYSRNNLVIYKAGEGNDTIEGFKPTDKISITGGKYSSVKSGNHIIFNVGKNKVTLKNFSNNVTLTNGDDTYTNNVNKATIRALGGNDEIYNNGSKNVSILGGAGNDIIYNNVRESWNATTREWETISSPDSSTISGGDGDDNIENYGSKVSITSGAGSDYIYNSEGNSVSIAGGAGDDSIYNDGGANVSINTGAGNDIIYNDQDWKWNEEKQEYEYISPDNALINAGDGDNRISNSGDSSTIISGAGNDSIDNFGENVTIAGGDGDDSIDNYGNDVTINGGAGDDYIYNSEGNFVSIAGGAGNDSIYNNGGDNVTINSGEGDDDISNSGGYVTISSGDGNDSIDNWGGYTTINAGTGNDSIFNDGDNCLINSGDGNDTISVQGGLNLTINAGTGNDYIENYGEANSLFGGEGADTIWGGEYKDTISGGDGNDSLLGGAGDDSIVGNAGNDKLYGNAGNDKLYGSAGNDKLYGNSGKDSLWGGAGNDTLWGGNGKDVFTFLANNGADYIMDYESGELLRIYNKSGKAKTSLSKSAFSNDTLTLTINGGGTIILNDVGKSDVFNINGTSYKISGTKLVK